MSKKYNARYKNLGYFKAIFNFFKRISVLYKYLLDKNVSVLKKILVISMLAYVISPLDIIPEVVLGFGFLDDAMIAIYVISSISDELDKYISKDEEENMNIDEEKIIDNVKYEVRDQDKEEK